MRNTLPYLILLASTGLLSSCFQNPLKSSGLSREGAKAERFTQLVESKAVSAVAADSKTTQTIAVAGESTISGTKLSVQPGALSVSANIILEQGADLADSGVAGELTLQGDIAITGAAAGVIVRPSENVILKKPLQLSLPLPLTTGLRLNQVSYAVYYKYLDPTSQQLMTGIIPVDGTRARLVFDDKLARDQVEFEGYFGSYWVVSLSREPSQAEIPTAQVATTPIVNKNLAAVITGGGVVKEKEVVTIQSKPALVWERPSLAFDAATRVISISYRNTATLNLTDCAIDIFENATDLTGLSSSIPAFGNASIALRKVAAHRVVGRYRCLDAEGRAALSPWSEPLSIPGYAALAVKSVNATSTDGFYGLGNSLTLTVEWTGPVSVTGQPSLSLKLGTVERKAVYASGSDSSTLSFQYTVQAGDNSQDLDYSSVSALSLEGGRIVDKNGQSVLIALPKPAAPQSLAANRALIVDTTAPVDPGAVTFTPPSANATLLPIQWTSGFDLNPKLYNAKLCAQNDCSTTCGSVIQSVTSPANLQGALGTSSFVCVQTVDQLGLTSEWVSSVAAATFSSGGTPANVTISQVTSATSNGVYKATDIIYVDVVFSAPVTISNPSDTYFNLKVGASTVGAEYDSGNGTSTLRYRYTIMNGHNGQSIDAESTAALQRGSASFSSSTGGTVMLTVPIAPAGNALSSTKNLNVDTTPPTLPSSVGFTQSVTNSLSVPVSFGHSTDTYPIQYDAKLCLDTACSTGCRSIAQGSNSPIHVPAISGSSFRACVQAKDSAGNTSAWAFSTQSVFVDQELPTVLGVSSSHTPIYVGPGANIPIQITFSENVVVTNGSDIKLHLNAGGPNPYADYVSTVGATMNFNYAVQSGATSNDLDYVSGSSIIYGTNGRIQDLALNDAISSLPPPGSAQSLSAQSNLVVDTTPPTFNGGIYELRRFNETNVDISWNRAHDTQNDDSDLIYEICYGPLGDDCSSWNTVATAVPYSYSHRVTSIGSSQEYEFSVRAKDKAGNVAKAPNRGRTTPLSNVLDMAISDNHGCAVLTGSGEVYCWGANHYGQIGNNSNVAALRPVRVPGLAGVTQVAVGSSHSCARLSNGDVKCWGYNSYGQLGDQTQDQRWLPVSVYGVTGSTHIVASGDSTCAILGDATVKCWGNNLSKQLGLASPNYTTAETIPGLSAVDELVMGLRHTCALTSNSVKCWGSGVSGQAGYIGADSATPFTVSLPSSPGPTKVFAGGDNSCAQLLDNTVRCWGLGTNGVLTATSGTPVPITDLNNALDIKIDANNICFRNSSDTVSCWGKNYNGELGSGNLASSLTPVPVLGMTGVSRLASGPGSFCGLRSGAINCWGQGPGSSLGSGFRGWAMEPIQIPGSNINQHVMGDVHSCAIQGDNSVACWGTNRRGQIANSSGLSSEVPSAVISLSNVTQISTRGGTTCAIDSTRNVYCWGEGTDNKFANGSSSDLSTATQIAGLSNVLDIGVGSTSVCAVTAPSGNVKCWGSNTYGQLGNGNNSNTTSIESVSGLANATKVSIGEHSACALTSTQDVLCWGRGTEGALGNGTFTDAWAPVSTGLTGVTALSANSKYVCAVSAGKLYCWGTNSNGALGLGSPTQTSIPTQVDAGVTYKAVATGPNHMCAITDDDRVKCTGSNNMMQLGDSTFTGPGRNTMAYVPGIRNVKDLTLGIQSTCALLHSKEIRCWGHPSGSTFANSTKGVQTRPSPVTAPAP